MKKTLILMLFVMACGMIAEGRESNAAHVKVGFGATGLNMGDLPSNMKPEFHVGGGYEFALNNRCSLLTDFAISYQGSVIETKDHPEARQYFTTGDANIAINDNVTWHAIYFQLPVAMRYYVTPRFSADIGLQAGIDMYNKLKMNGNTVYKLHRSYETFDAGAVAGLNYHINNRLFIQARYYQGFVKVFKWVDISEYGGLAKNKNLDSRNFGISVSVGYEF